MSEETTQTSQTAPQTMRIEVAGQPSTPASNGHQPSGALYDPTADAPDGWTQTKAPDGWHQSAWDQMQKERQRMRNAEARVAKLTSELSAATEQLGQVDALQNQIATMQRNHKQDLVFLEAGGGFTHPSVRRMARREFDDHIGELKQQGVVADELPDFGTWLHSDSTKSNPLMAPHYPQAQVSAENELPVHSDNEPAPQTNQRKSTGTVQTFKAPKTEWTDEKIALSKARGRWKVGKVDLWPNGDYNLVGGSKDWQDWMRWRDANS